VSPTAPVLEIDSLRVLRAGRFILDIDALAINEPSLTVIEGGTGSGKTTFASALVGSIPASGTIRVGGAAVSGPPFRRVSRGLAGTVRDGARINSCTVAEALLMAATRRPRAIEALDRFELLAARRGVASQLLSGGEQQLLQVACA
jgi:ABC-type branched-subunit amino acid transport system ATPase component